MQKVQNQPAQGHTAVRKTTFAEDLAQLRKYLGGCYAILKRWEETLEKRQQAA
jgi:hypothetical protein